MDAAVQSRSDVIRTINDRCRKHFLGCTVMVTPTVQELSESERAQLVKAVRDFDQFDAGNDPHHEHDFRAIELFGERWFWKYDLYEEPGVRGSDGEPIVTRLLTIMLAEEY